MRLRRLAVAVGLLLATVMSVPAAWADWGSSVNITFTPLSMQAPIAVTNLAAFNGADEGAVNLVWSAPYIPPGTPVTAYEVRAATFSIDSLSGNTTSWWNNASLSQSFPESVLPGTTNSFLLEGLTQGVTWYFAIKSRPTVTVWWSPIDVRAATPGNQAHIFVPDITPLPPTNLVVVQSTSPIVILSWDSMIGRAGYSDFDRYRVYRSFTNGPLSSFVSVGVSTFSAFVDQAVTVGATYYYYVTGVDLPPLVLESTASAVVSAVVPRPKPLVLDATVPNPPTGLQLAIVNYHAVLAWNIPLYNTDGSPLIDLASFRIYRASRLEGPWSQIGSVPYDGNTHYEWTDSSIDLSNSAVYYYRVRCVDQVENISRDSMVCDTSIDLNVIAVSGDNQLTMVVPKRESATLYRGNGRADDVEITINEIGLPAVNGALLAFEYTALEANTREKINGFLFDHPVVKAVWQYKASSLLNSLEAKKKAPVDVDNELAMFWHNGVEWLKLSKVLNTDSMHVNVRHLGKFMIKQSLKADSFTLTKVYPSIFTPNGDNRNDYMEIRFENPRDDEVTGKIFDVRGGYINKLQKNADGTSMTWDGTMEGGKIVEPGVYVYQIEVVGQNSKVFNGVVVVVK